MCVMMFGMFGQVGAASADEVPSLCQDTDCTEAMVAIDSQFQKLSSAPNQAEFPRVFSGECYMMNFGPDPSMTQYGLMLLKQDSNAQPLFMALFSFFNESNPYLEMPLDEAEKTLLAGGSYPTKMVMMPDHAFVQYKTEGSEINYWFRQDPKSSDIYVVSRWMFFEFGHLSQLFCHLQPNNVKQ